MDEEEYELLHEQLIERREQLLEMNGFTPNLRNRMRMTALMYEVALVSYEPGIGRAKLEQVLMDEYKVLVEEIARIAELN